MSSPSKILFAKFFIPEKACFFISVD